MTKTNADCLSQANQIVQDGLPSSEFQDERILEEKMSRESKGIIGFQALQHEKRTEESTSILSQAVDTACKNLPSLVEAESNCGKWQRLEGSASPLGAT
jgi:hypothetical protein